MKKIINLTEKDLKNIIQKVLLEQFVGAPLKFGDRNSEVIQLQQQLMNLGFLKTQSMKPTGYFGNLTLNALKRFQAKNKISPTGQLDPETKKRLSMLFRATKPAGIKPTQDKPQEKKPTQQPIEKKKSEYQLTPRIDQELDYIKQRGLDEKPFFVYDPKDNLIYLFNKGGVLVDYSQVIDGADTQKDKPTLDTSTWCKLSGLEISPFMCTDPKTKQKKEPYYSVLANTAQRFLTKGIYSISGIFRNEGYSGVGRNTFRMVDDKGNPIAAAIHGIPNLPPRLKASDDLEKLLKKDLSSGKVPEKYLNSIKTIANANQSFGCVGVPAKFIENPQVQGLAKGARVFVMGEGKSFLVQNAENYFDKLHGVGESCVNPTSLANNMSNMA